MAQAKAKATVTPLATIEQFGTYHLITFGTPDGDQFQVTVDNAGMVRLPQVVPPAQIQLLVGALEAAESVAVKQQEDNHTAQQQMNEFFAAQRAERGKIENRAAMRAKPHVEPAKRATATKRAPSKVSRPRSAAAVKREATPPLQPAPPRKAPPRKQPEPAKKAAATKKAAPKARKRSG